VERAVNDRARPGLDAALALLIFAVCAGRLAAFPLQPGHADEAHYLHEAKRVLQGERLYRDVFELTTPGWVYLMALLFEVFGVTLRTARMAAAVIHGATAALLFIVCRRLDVRRGFALAAAATYLWVCPQMFPVASQHWLATLLGVLVLALCLRPLRPWLGGALGFVAGLMIAVHQARGLAMAAGVAAFLTVDSLVLQRDHRSQPLAVGIAFAAGLLLATVPMLGAATVSAGFEPVWYALVMHPMQSYASTFVTSWGRGGSTVFSVRGLVTYVPLALLCVIPRVLYGRHSGADPRSVRAGAAVLLLGGASVASVWYYPDAIHLAFIAPLFFAAAADGLERAVRRLAGPVQNGVAWAIAVAIVVPIGVGMTRELAARSSRRLTTVYRSAFGPVEVFPSHAAMLDDLSRLLDAVPSRTLYCHGYSAYTYLLVDGRNPTRFEFVRAGYTTAAQVEEIVAVLRTQDVPYVWINPRDAEARDPITIFIRDHYERVEDAALQRWGLWQRRAPGAAGRHSSAARLG